MAASLTILGLYEWNEGIFDNLELPTGLDRNIVIPEIVTQCSDFCLLYPDYDFMKMLIGVWSRKEVRIWADLLRSETFEYNPIENYDRYEEIERTVEGESTSSTTSSRTSSGNASNTTTGAQTAYNDLTFADTGRTISTGTNSGTESGTDSGEGTSNGTENVSAHMHGNIGVTTAQQMIQGFREISDFCTVDFIVQSFKDRFCIQVY